MRAVFVAILIAVASPARADCAAGLDAAFARLQAEPHEMRADLPNGDGTTTAVRVTIVPGSGIEITSGSFGAVVLGDRGWVNEGSGWQPMDAAGLVLARDSIPYDLRVLRPSATDVTCLADGFAFRSGSQHFVLRTDPATGLPAMLQPAEPGDEARVRYRRDGELSIMPPDGAERQLPIPRE